MERNLRLEGEPSTHSLHRAGGDGSDLCCVRVVKPLRNTDQKHHHESRLQFTDDDTVHNIDIDIDIDIDDDLRAFCDARVGMA